MENIVEGLDSEKDEEEEEEKEYEQEKDDSEQRQEEEEGEESTSDATTPHDDDDRDEPVIVPPYLKILTSVPFLSVMIAQTGNLWAQYTTNTLTPTYLKYVQGVPDNLVSGSFAFPQYRVSKQNVTLEMVLSVRSHSNNRVALK